MKTLDIEYEISLKGQDVFDEKKFLNKLHHYLPAQAPLKDFIHHNTLHSFQDLHFDEAVISASRIFGYKTLLRLKDYRNLYNQGKINDKILNRIIAREKGENNIKIWHDKLLHQVAVPPVPPRIGTLRSNWKKIYKTDINSLVHPILFRTICSYLDQGISIWNFPVTEEGFLHSIRQLERSSFTSFFRRERAKELLFDPLYGIPELLSILLGGECLFEHYLFDQQFAHQGWSGLVAVVEKQPGSLLDQKKISLKELIIFELLLEIDALDFQFGVSNWDPLMNSIEKPSPLFDEVSINNDDELLLIWQKAMEWTYYDEVISALTIPKTTESKNLKSFQAVFCIDDRELSLRRYIEQLDPDAETLATPGHYGIEFYFKPEHGKFHTKVCPAPLNPKHIIKETGTFDKRKKDPHFHKTSHSLFRGWFISQTLGFWSAVKLMLHIFRPTMNAFMTSSFNHMDKYSNLTIRNTNLNDIEDGLQIGFTVDEMVDRVEAVLKSMGMIDNFASIVYLFGHGSSSINNPHFAAYDCGACSGRPGSVNARVFCYMVNLQEVRSKLIARGIHIPETTQFIGGLHDTCRDEVEYFDEKFLSTRNNTGHAINKKIIQKALHLNAKERSRKFNFIDSTKSAEKIHEKVKKRSVSIFETRPELNHANNALCIIADRKLSKNIFFDRRAFLNSHDYKIDPEGKYLYNILKAAAPVCGGINLEYFFSRVDSQKLGAGSKLPHNVMGLFAVANGMEGDLRSGLPEQMTEMHDPVRLLMIIEHYPEIVLASIKKDENTYEWFKNEWIHLSVIDPGTGQAYIFKNEKFEKYETVKKDIPLMDNVIPGFENNTDNIPIHIIEKWSR